MTEEHKAAWSSKAIQLDAYLTALAEDAEAKRTVVAERDMPRVREWVNQAVAHAVNDAAQALNAIRYWCDRQQAEIEACPLGHDPQLCPPCSARAYYIAEIRALLPALPEPNRRAEHGGEDGDARDASDPTGRPGLVTRDP